MNFAYDVRKRMYATAAGVLEVTFDKRGILEAVFIQDDAVVDGAQCITDTLEPVLQGTEFQIKVWQATQAIPVGQTRTYKDVAVAIGKPKAYRAVARALACNKIAYFIPCHRVLGSNGALRGYAWGLERKAALLAYERSLGG